MPPCPTWHRISTSISLFACSPTSAVSTLKARSAKTAARSSWSSRLGAHQQRVCSAAWERGQGMVKPHQASLRGGAPSRSAPLPQPAPHLWQLRDPEVVFVVVLLRLADAVAKGLAQVAGRHGGRGGGGRGEGSVAAFASSGGGGCERRRLRRCSCTRSLLQLCAGPAGGQAQHGGRKEQGWGLVGVVGDSEASPACRRSCK